MEGFFMPENIKMLKNLWYDNTKTPRPHLDESKIEEMERLLTESFAKKVLFRDYHMEGRLFYFPCWIRNQN
jgi:hypothetical protein